jgi:tetratricopeptide (TPR) repeat protein
LILSGHRPTDEREEAYEKAAAKAQTADDHYRLAQQCSAANLRELALAHFLRAIELNPDLTEARAAVKHRQSDSGRWIRTEDHMHRMGKIEVGAKWVYPEHAHEENLKAEQEKNVKAVKKEIQTFHQAFIKNSPKADQALAAVEQLNDPIAIEVFAEKLADKVLAGQKPIPDGLKLVYVRLLAKFESVVATDALATACVFDSSERIRNAALDVLVKNGRGQAIYRISAWLRDANNVIINRAAYALGKLEASEATLDLINALVTKHERQVSPQADTFTPDGTTFGGPKKVMVDVKNEQVRNALAQITGQGNLGYDKVAWLAWFANVYAPPVDDLRRDF